MTAHSSAPRASGLRFAAPAGLLLLTGFISVWAFRGANTETTPPPISSTPSAESASVESDQIAPLARRSAQASPRSARGVESAVFPDLATGFAQLHQSMATSPVKAVERDRAVADLDSRHESESIDPVWSATSEQGLAAASVSPVMAQAGFNPQDVSSDCRSRTCRISARFDNSSEARHWADRLLTQMAGTLGQAKVAVLPQADGSFEVRVYGARKQS